MADFRGAGARYSSGAVALHWLIAALMLFQLALGLTMGEGHSAASFARFQLHKSVGITILLLTLVRIGWRLTHRAPPSLIDGWEHALSRLVHALFYGLLLALPLSGWLIVSLSPTHIPTLLYGTIPWPHLPGAESLAADDRRAVGGAAGSVHVVLAWTAIAAIALHVAGALKHQIIDRDGTFARMMPGAGRGLDPRLGAVLALALVVIAAGVVFHPAAPGQHAPPQIAAAPIAPAAPAQQPEVAPVTAPAAADAKPETAAETDAAPPTDAAGAIADWKVQPGGKLAFVASWSGNTLPGTFTDWSATIRFGEAALDQSRVKVTIKTGSARTGEAQPDSTLPTDDWFAASSFPTATFEATKFRKTGEGRYVATGTLTIRGKSRPLTLPFTLKIRGDTATMAGSTTIDRTAFGIGFPGTEEVAAAVTLNVSLTAKRQ